MHTNVHSGLVGKPGLIPVVFWIVIGFFTETDGTSLFNKNNYIYRKIMQDKPSVTHWPELVFHHIYWNIQ